LGWRSCEADPMKIVALLSWYEEDPRWLAEMVASLPNAGVDHLVALDGAYAMFPGATPQSHPSQAAVIRSACERHGIGCTIHQPTEVFHDNEVEKRSLLFQLGEEVTGPDDWYLVMDADELSTDVPGDFRQRLATTTRDVAEVTFQEPDPDETGNAANYSKWRRKNRFEIRVLFRAIRGLRVKGNHWTYMTPDGRRLWGQNKRSLEPTLDLTDLEIFHRSDLRNEARRADQFAYYQLRDERQIELGYCKRCKKKAIKSVPVNWQPSPEGLTADYIDCCAKHAKEVLAENAPVLRSHGIDPKTMRPMIGALV
jgi:hypothetical protein